MPRRAQAPASISGSPSRRSDKGLVPRPLGWTVARVTGLEPATSGVTGRRSNQLSYTRVFGVGGDLGGGLFGVNHRGLHLAFLVLLLLVRIADVGQRAMLEQEAGDIGRSGGGENRLEDDQQRHRKQGAGSSPYPRPEGQRDEDRQRADGQPVPDDERGEDVRL